MLKRLSLFIVTALLSCAAFGQSAPGFTYGQVPTPGQWNSYFSGKMDFAMPLAAGNVLTSNGSGWYSGPPATHGTVTGLSVNMANGLSGTVATPSTTPAITLGTTVTGMVKGNGAALSAAVAGMDYSAGTASNATGIVKSATGTGALTTAIASDFPILNQNTTGNAATATTAGNVTGIVAIANGGTGASTASSALTNLGAASIGANSSITSLTGLTTPLSLSQGGTASTTAAAAFNTLSPMTTTGDTIYEASSGTAARLPIGSTGQVYTVVSGKPAWSTAGAVIAGYVNGFTLSNDGTTPNSVLDIAAGTAVDSTNAAMITGTAFTKSTAGTWATGSGSNGMGAGLTITPSTWYHVFAIVNNGAFDVYFDTSPAAVNKPSGTTAFRYIGSFKTNASSQILAFTQYGQRFVWAATPVDLNGGNATTETPVTLSVPLGLVTFPMLRISSNVGAANNAISIFEGTSSVLDGRVWGQVASTMIEGQLQSVTNTTSQVSYLTASASNGVVIFTIGYINPRVAPNF